MIVYNVKRRWFTMKNDAETYRKAEGLQPSATFKLEINDRDGLAALLNGLTSINNHDTDTGTTPPAPSAVLERNQVEFPDYVPEFIRKEHREKERLAAAVRSQRGS